MTRTPLSIAPSLSADLTFQEDASLPDVLRVFAPDQTPGVFELGLFGHGTLGQLAVVFLLEFLSRQE